MNYAETTAWMFAQLPMYQTQGAIAYKADLSNALKFAHHLGNPEKRLKFIHVAGTNGKGSTSHMLASIFQEAGYKTGLYTSPHLKDYRERIKIDGEPISEMAVTAFIAQHKSYFEDSSLSFFEMSVGLAFDYFIKNEVDFAIIETGLGGRLDATNIITPLLSVITNIGLDHTQFLGNTLAAIAGEKAGIIKQGVPVVIGEYTIETRPVFATKAKDSASAIYYAAEHYFSDYESDLKGNYQRANRKTVQTALKVLLEKYDLQITDENIKSGLANVVKNTGFLGRWQQINDRPTVICDTAHNFHGLSLVIHQLLQLKFNQLHIVLGFVNDKKLDEILPLFPKDAIYYFCRPNNNRGLSEILLQVEADKLNLKGEAYNSVSGAYRAALDRAEDHDIIYVGGSTFVVAEII